ncbi:T9SS type A sorting domain-containing protein [Rubrivirga sp. IMCC45206]|uniref:T9SS type A sorting domain-containing protein n=1 Tax=Rubrivirga sp. IMCC45206 TaxID=3391614 RepID=UPI0039902E13
MTLIRNAEVVAAAEVPASLTVPAGYTTKLRDATLAFAPWTGLVIESDGFSAKGGAFTASDPALGWAGIRLEPGAKGRFTGRGGPVRIEEVAGIGAAIYARDARLVMNDVEITGRVQQPADQDLEVSAVWATGSDTRATLSNVVMTPHTSTEVMAAAGARINVTGSTVEGTVGSWGYGGSSRVYAWGNNTIVDGTSAQSYGLVWHGWPDHTEHPFPTNRLALLDAWNYGDSFAGSDQGEGARNNRVQAVTGERGFVEARYTSDITAEYAYWGDPSGPDLVRSVVETGSTFDYCPYLSAPSAGAVVACTPAAGALGGDAVAADRAEYDAARAAGDMGETSHVEAYVRSSLERKGPEWADVRRRALGLAARAASQSDDPRSAAGLIALLAAHADEGGPDASEAYRALAVAHAGQQDHVAALAAAEKLAGFGGADGVQGAVLAALAYGALDRPDRAFEVLGRAHPAAADAPDVRMAMRELRLRYPGAEAPAAGASVVAAPTSDRTAPMLGAPRPNPTAGRTVIAVHVAAEGPLRISVVDVLGREVAVVFDGHAEPGVREVSFDAGEWAPGVYLVRAAGAGQAVRTFTVHR